MKLYLSSYRLGDNPDILVNLVGENKKVAVVANSMDFLTDDKQRAEAAAREIEDMQKLGLQPEEVDLRKYFGKPQELAETMRNYGAIWVRGGNVFVLRRAFSESGMDEWLKSQKDNGELVYGGYSAGVCVLSPTLKGLEIVDDSKKVPDGYKDELSWEGLGLIDYSVAPHYMSPHPESEAVNLVVSYFEKEGINYKAIRDGEVIVQEI